MIVDMFIVAALSFAVFYFIASKLLSINWKKSLAAFLFVIIILAPVLSYFKGQTEMMIAKYSPFVEEVEEMIGKIWFFGPGIPPELRIMSNIERATLSWPADYLASIALIIQTQQF